MKRSPLAPSLFAPDMPATIDFYVDTLGFEQTGEYKEDNGRTTWAEVALGEARIWLFAHALPGQPAPTFSGMLFVFVDDVDAWADKLRGKVNIRWGPKSLPYGLRELGIEDPNGYILVLTKDE